MVQSDSESNLFHRASLAVDKWLELHKGESFDLDLICRQLEIRDAAKRHAIAQKLAYEVGKRKLEKVNRVYRYIDNSIVLLNDWNTLLLNNRLDLLWPAGTDGSQFGFDGHVEIPERGLVVIAGVTNTGKSTFLRNLLWMNMKYKHCTYFTSETSKEDFADYASRMTWECPFDQDGKPIFDLIDRYKDFQDVIRPDDINIIDWLNLGDKFFQLGEILMKIKTPLRHGIAVVAIQKDAHKELGMGGQWGEHLASLYISMDFERLTVKKAKKWTNGYNPNGKTWGFKIEDRGCHFADIHGLVKCGACFEGKSKGHDCTICGGTGWMAED